MTDFISLYCNNTISNKCNIKNIITIVKRFYDIDYLQRTLFNNHLYISLTYNVLNSYRPNNNNHHHIKNLNIIFNECNNCSGRFLYNNSCSSCGICSNVICFNCIKLYNSTLKKNIHFEYYIKTCFHCKKNVCQDCHSTCLCVLCSNIYDERIYCNDCLIYVEGKKTNLYFNLSYFKNHSSN